MLEDYIRSECRRRALMDEAKVRSLLEQWVSELEPAIALDKNGEIIGLTLADAPLGSKPPIFRGRE